jgi:hypothetical protein
MTGKGLEPATSSPLNRVLARSLLWWLGMDPDQYEVGDLSADTCSMPGQLAPRSNRPERLMVGPVTPSRTLAMVTVTRASQLTPSAFAKLHQVTRLDRPPPYHRDHERADADRMANGSRGARARVAAATPMPATSTKRWRGGPR